MKRLYRALPVFIVPNLHSVTFSRRIVIKNGQFGKTAFGTHIVQYVRGCQSESGGTKK